MRDFDSMIGPCSLLLKAGFESSHSPIHIKKKKTTTTTKREEKINRKDNSGMGGATLFLQVLKKLDV